MEILEAISKRMSIRGFRPAPVPKEVLEKILESAGRTPSALNSQPWEFTVVTGEALERIKEENIEHLLTGAPVRPGGVAT